jgi:diadenylate cyclase
MLAAALPWLQLAPFDLRAALDILIIAALLYYVLKLFRGTRAVQLMVAIVLMVLFYKGARWLRLDMVEWLLTTMLPYFAIALIVLFQPEIRRALARLGHTPFWGRFSARDSSGVMDDLVLAASYFSQNRIGALVALERDTGLRTYIESGLPLDAALSYDLLLAIFHPSSPMHDGAVIVQGSRVAAAACFLPLTLNPSLSTQLGTRHRAAIGVTEESDSVALVVSERTGAISLAVGGALETNLAPEQLSSRLSKLFSRFGARPAVHELPAGLRSAMGRK